MCSLLVLPFARFSSSFFGTCLECFTEAAIPHLQRGHVYDSNCRSCHQRLSVRFDQFEFVRITAAALIQDAPKEDTRGAKAAAAIDPRELAAAKNRKKEQALLKVGTALPNKGACKHYSKSYRWMRSDAHCDTVTRTHKLLALPRVQACAQSVLSLMLASLAHLSLL